jgi:glycosyltransferase involved in cell wall biosynthesis
MSEIHARPDDGERKFPSITVLMTTLNRAQTLRTTLSALCRVRRAGLSVQIVVVDNGSTDETSEVLAEFVNALPLRCLKDPVPGKAHALNHALCNAEMGDIIVFTDDDITPDEGWLEAIVETCDSWPKHAVFGGKIDPLWPDGQNPPAWADQEVIQSLAFARHHISDDDGEYPPDKDPFGGNFWVRQSALSGVRFLELIGAHPTQQRLGDETHFVRQLRRKGMVPIYSARPRVQHRLGSARITKAAVYRRAVQGGLGVVYVHGLPEKQIFRRSQSLWMLRRVRAIIKIIFQFPLVAASRDECWRVLNTTYLLWSICEHAQALRLSFIADSNLRSWICHLPERD